MCSIEESGFPEHDERNEGAVEMGHNLHRSSQRLDIAVSSLQGSKKDVRLACQQLGDVILVIDARWSTRAPRRTSSINSLALVCPQTFACSSSLACNQCVPMVTRTPNALWLLLHCRVRPQVEIEVHTASYDAKMTKAALSTVDVTATAYHNHQAVSNFVDTPQPSLHRSRHRSPQSSDPNTQISPITNQP